MAIALWKKRYQISLTEETFEQLKSLYNEAGAPSYALSKEMDEHVQGMVSQLVEHFGRIKEKGLKPSYSDIQVCFGEIV